jgi:cytochrome c-type biogenesis protein
MMDLGLTQPGLAFAAGLLTVAAPCVLPLLPVVLGAASVKGASSRPVFITVGFILSFTVFALFFSSFQHFLGLEQQTVRDVASVLMVLFGLSMVWPALFQHLTSGVSGVLNRVAAVGNSDRPGWLGGVLIGVSLGAIWTPCAGPVLATILTLVATQANWVSSTLLLGLYALGAAIPMLAIAYGGQWAADRVHTLVRHTHRLQQIMGVVVATVGLLTLLQYDTVVTVWLSNFYPSISGGL